MAVDNGIAPDAGDAVRSARYRKWREWGIAYFFLFPTVLGIVLLQVVPVLRSAYFSFTDFNGVQPPEWVGLQNYADLGDNPLFWKVLRNTVYYTVGFVPLNIALALFLALMVNQTIRGVTLFRALYFMPVVTSLVAISLVWAWLYQPQFGLVNYFLGLAKIPGPGWLSSTEWSMPALFIMGAWRQAGFNMVIFLAGLKGISQELYEAATVDGAGWFRRFFHITLPMLSPTMFFVVVVSVIGSFQVFEQTYVLTQGGPAYSTLTLSYWIYQNAFEWFNMGKASALAYSLFVVVMFVTLIQFAGQRKWVFYR